jgi:polyhydroxybutyrate depolymerase
MTQTILRIMGGVLLLASQSAAFHPVKEEQFTFDDRLVRVVRPARLHRHHPKVPLVLALTGFGVEGDKMLISDGGVGYGELPKKFPVIIAAPNGSIHPHPDVGTFFWNATPSCCGFEHLYGPQVDDVDYLSRLIDELLERYPVDPRRIYVVGHSNGGTMIHRLACDVPDRFAAFVALAGATFNDPADCQLAQPINLIHVHGTADDGNLFEGGEFPAFPGSTYPGAVTTVQTVAEKAGCDGALQEIGRHLDLAPGVPGAETVVLRQKGCPPGHRRADIQLWKIEGGDHLWFLPPGSRTAELTWRWMKRHVLPPR